MDKKGVIQKIKALFSEESEVLDNTEKVTEEKCCDNEECNCTEEALEEVKEEVKEEVTEEIKEEAGEVEDVIEEVIEEDKVEEAFEEVIEKDPLLERIESLEKSIANLSESLSAVELLNEKVEKLSKAPADEEIKLKKSEGGKLKKSSSLDEKLNFLSRRK